MLMPNKALQLVQLLHSTKREKRLGTVILFVTSRCNAFCKTCFYHEELNQPGDMSFGQIEKVSRTMPPITDLWLSGGEPTLRRDVPEVIDMFVANNRVRSISISTSRSTVMAKHTIEFGGSPETGRKLWTALSRCIL